MDFDFIKVVFINLMKNLVAENCCNMFLYLEIRSENNLSEMPGITRLVVSTTSLFSTHK